MADEQKDPMQKYIDDTKKLEEKLNNEAKIWSSRISECTSGMKGKIQELSNVEANVLSYKHMVEDEIRTISLIMYKESSSLKLLIKKRFEYYSTNYQIVVKNSTDKNKLIEADISKIQYKIDLLDVHISFLRDTASNFKSLTYSVKNRIELLNILGMD